MGQQDQTGSTGGEAAGTTGQSAGTGAGVGQQGSQQQGQSATAQQQVVDYQAKFEAQQQVNRDQETKLNQLRDGLKAALGIEAERKADPQEILAALGDVGELRRQVTDLQRANEVAAIARTYGITSDDDIALLAGIGDTDAMTKLAARLAPQGGSDGGKSSGKPGTPKPNPNQGQGGNSQSGARPTSVTQVMEDRRAARERK